MRIPWTAAERLERLQLELVCKHCRTLNVPKTKPRIELDQDGKGASCNECGFSGPLADFLPKGVA